MRRLFFLFFSIFISVSVCSAFQLKGITDNLGILKNAAKATQKAARPISNEEEYFVGRAVAARILSTYPLSKKKEMTEYVNLVGQSIVAHSDKPYTYGGYHFAILDSKEKNAFACPGGIIFITQGMLNEAKNEDELAAVLAHEIAHINHRDGISAIKSSRWTEALSVIGTEAAKQYGSHELSKLVSIFEGSIDDVFKTLVVNGYSKSQEYDADRTALVYLGKAGYNPGSLKDFLERLCKQGSKSEGGILKTHPETADRIENIKEKVTSKKVDNSLLLNRTKRFNSIVL
jgi:predicted Zn-dependent protease